MTIDNFEALLANDCPGPNKNKMKVNHLRSFQVPDYMIEPGSSPNQIRRVNMFAAFIMQKHVIVLVDFARLIRLHVISGDVMWAAEDLHLNSEVRYYCSAFSCNNKLTLV